MTPEKDAFTEILVDLPVAEGQNLVRIVDATTVPGLEGYFETIYEENKRSDRTQLYFYFDPEDAQAEIKMELLLATMDLSDYSISRKLITRLEYLESYKQHYRSFAIGKTLAIVPSWKRGSVEEAELKGRLILYLDPGLAFGTGLHPTTRMCLTWMEQNQADLKDRSIIDAGSGSGILSLFALLLGAGKVLAFDLESNAARATRQNLELNPGIEASHLLLRHSGFELEELDTFPAEIFVGNLTSNIILGARERILAARHSRMILTGILSEQKESITEAFRDWTLTSQVEDDGWCLLDLKRNYGAV
ncbi:MAG: 50S ribosomal protein L11 methyltransferase [Spirochaetia bacterium]|nr:50S ribosomal protein L11 methyltransferase [Spirochaetia bacterium]